MIAVVIVVLHLRSECPAAKTILPETASLGKLDSACVRLKSGYHKGWRFTVAASTREIALQIAESLSPKDRRRLLEELIVRTANDAHSEPQHSVMELRGLGAEIWGGIDVQEYVSRERASWNG